MYGSENKTKIAIEKKSITNKSNRLIQRQIFDFQHRKIQTTRLGIVRHWDENLAELIAQTLTRLQIQRHVHFLAQSNEIGLRGKRVDRFAQNQVATVAIECQHLKNSQIFSSLNQTGQITAKCKL